MSEQAGSTSNGSKMVGPREVVVRGNAKGFTQEIVVGPHQLTADEPKDMGGDDEGPTPSSLARFIHWLTVPSVTPRASAISFCFHPSF